MKPDSNFITINNNLKLIKDFISNMIIEPRVNFHKWSNITNQTPNLKIGYPGQHLASLITGMKGNATGARGNDIIDGSEVKSCSKVDQSDKCLDCKETVLRINEKCPHCGSKNIKRNNDSKWLISIKNEDELRMYLDETPRFIFIVTDYPNFLENNFDDIRIRCFEIWVKSKRCINFVKLLINYYNYIYLNHIKLNPNKTPAPKNLFPDDYQFYMCNPIKIFDCLILNSLSGNSKININKYIHPEEDRSDLESENMPINKINNIEKNILKSKGIDINSIGYIDENIRSLLRLRDTDKKIKVIGTKKHKK